MSKPFQSVEETESALQDQNYFADRSLAVSIFLSLRLEKPLFLEGEAGVGKTEVAKVLAALQGTRLIRLQCYEGLDVHSAVYEWNYSRQLLEIRLLEAAGEVNREAALRELFGPSFLLKRPLLQAIDCENHEAPVLLIDELDRADEEFEAFLLEVLSDFQISIPEIGTLKARRVPPVVITSNRTREIHDALKRRCLYHWIDYPSFEKECRIVLAKVPEAAEELAVQAVRFVQRLRAEDLYKRPGVAETLDWVKALTALSRRVLDASVASDTLGLLLKYQDDIEKIRGQVLERLLNRVSA